MTRKLSVSLIAVLSALAVGLLSMGCATVTKAPKQTFGTEFEIDQFLISTEKTGEAEMLVTISHQVPETLKAEVRIGRQTIGYNYSSRSTGNDLNYYSKFYVSPLNVEIKDGDTTEFTIVLDNLYQVSRPFHTTIHIKVKGASESWKFEIPVKDDEMITDMKYLKELNTTDYWHPRLIDENMAKYMAHIEE